MLQFNGTEEWLHLGYNTFYLARAVRADPAAVADHPHGPLRRWAFAFFIVASVWIETWHIVEHGVIISHVIANRGCPCPGIGDVGARAVDTILHFVYNLLAYAGVAYAYVLIVRQRGHIFHRRTPR